MSNDSRHDEAELDPAKDPDDAARAVAVAEALAKPMFCLSLVFLVLLAALVVAWVDLLPDPVDQEMVTVVSVEDFWHHPSLQTGYLLRGLLLAIWPLFLVESLYVRWLSKGHAKSAKSNFSFDWFCVVCPPLRLGIPVPAKGGQIWLPRMGCFRSA